MAILTLLILPVREHRISFHFFVFFNFFQQFSVNGSFISFVKFIPRYFTLFLAIANGIVLISFSSISLSAYRNTADFWLLILYPTASLYLFMFNSLSGVAFLCIESCHLKIMTVLPFHSQFGSLFFPSLASLLWPGLPVLR